jgi:hypothetical protein
MNETTAKSRLGREFRALPELEPPAGTWAAIEARLDAPRRHTGVRAGAALAVVGLAALALTLRVGERPGGDPVAPPRAESAPGATAATDASLERRSSDLERLLAALPPTRTARASTGYTTTLLEDRIALVDERLSLPAAASLSPMVTAQLKRQRVVLLDSLVRVKYASAVTDSL